MNLCTAWNISVFRSYENDLFPCNNKSILMSILLLFGINVCMESNKINLKLLNLGQINKTWLLSSNEPLQFGQLVWTYFTVYLKYFCINPRDAILYILLAKDTLLILRVECGRKCRNYTHKKPVVEV